MTHERAILSVKYTPAVGRGAGLAVAGFLRYVQYRDHHQDVELDRRLEGFSRYLARRDRTAPHGRLFDAHGRAGDAERSALLSYVKRSTDNLRRIHSRYQARAVYRLVISPENAQGLDLQRLTRSVMAQLQADLGGELPPWIAAEHRNTKHPHVHIVLAAQREANHGEFRQLIVSKPRLARMKESLALDIELQREGRPRTVPVERAEPQRSVAEAPELKPSRRNRVRSVGVATRLRTALVRMAARYRAEAEREARRSLGWSRSESERER